MKTLLLILAIAVFPPAQINRLGITTEYDKFRDVTIVKNSQSIMPVRPGFVLFETVASIRGKYTTGAVPREVALVIESHSDEWVFLGQSSVLRVLYNDSERYALGTMKRVSGDVVGRGVVEILYLEVSIGAIEKLVKADSLEIQVGPLESEIKPEQRASIKEWLALFGKPGP